jgi:hypothetical protein
MATGIPLEDGYEATLTQALAGDSGALTIYVSKTPVFTFPSGQEVCFTINPKKGFSYQENVLVESYDATAKTLTVKTGGRAANRYNGDSPTPLSHAVGSKIIISDAYPVWNSLDDYVSKAGDTMTGPLAFDDATAAVRRDGDDLKFKDPNQAEVTLSQLASAAGVNDKAKVSAADTTEGYLDGKITAGAGLSKSITNPAGDEELDLSIDLTDTNVFSATPSAGKAALFDGDGNVPTGGLLTSGTAAEAITDKDVLTYAPTGRLARADADAIGTTFPLAGIATAAASGVGESVNYTPTGSIVEIPSLGIAEYANGILNAATPTNTSQNTATDAQDAATKWRAQTFTASSNAWENNIASVSLYLTKTGSPTGNATVKIYATSGGLPTGSALGSQTLAYSSIATGVNEFVFSTLVEITPGEVYAIVLDPGAGVSGGAYIAWNYQNTDVYAGGQSCTSANSGSTWTAEASHDRYFASKYASIVGCPAFIDDTTGAITLAVNAAGTNKYNQRIGYVVDRTHLMVERGLRNIYATYSYSAGATDATIETEITLGFRPMIVFCGVTLADIYFHGAQGHWLNGGQQWGSESKGNIEVYDGAGTEYNHVGGFSINALAYMTTQQNARPYPPTYFVSTLSVSGTTGNSIKITRKTVKTGAAGDAAHVVYLHIIGW